MTIIIDQLHEKLAKQMDKPMEDQLNVQLIGELYTQLSNHLLRLFFIQFDRQMYNQLNNLSV